MINLGRNITIFGLNNLVFLVPWVWKDLFIWIISYCQYYGPQTFAMGPHSSIPNLNKFKTSSNQTIYINFSFFLVGCWKLFILFVLYDELFSLKYALRRGLPL